MPLVRRLSSGQVLVLFSGGPSRSDIRVLMPRSPWLRGRLYMITGKVGNGLNKHGDARCEIVAEGLACQCSPSEKSYQNHGINSPLNAAKKER